MNRHFTLPLTTKLAILLLLIPFSLTIGQVEKAYEHLYKVMDQYHETFDVFTDHLSGGNLYYPAFIGNYAGLTLSTENDSMQYAGWSCMEIEYDPSVPSEYDWAGIQWLYPDTNWGYWPGRDLTGAFRLSFRAKGADGGEKVDFKVGGGNSSFDLLSTGVVELTNEWQEYSLDLFHTNYFAVYLDGNSGSDNHGYASGWFNGVNNMMVDPHWAENPYAGQSCFKVTWNGLPGNDFWRWNGIIWQYPEGNWGESNGLDLTGATRLTFWARTDPEHLGLKIKFFFGLDGIDSCGELPEQDWWVTLDTVWTQYEIGLTSCDSLTNIRGPFGFVFNDQNDPGPNGCTFYLDNIIFDLPLSNDLSNMIDGFICAMSEADNPDGCHFYLDEVRYELLEEAKAERKKEPHFLRSYVPIRSSEFFLQNTAFVYDNALAMLAFMLRGTEEDWERAETIGRAFIYCQENDIVFTGPLLDHRLRNAYISGELIHPHTGEPTLPIGVDEFNASTHVGNMAWAMIAMLAYYEHTLDEDFLLSAERMGEWIAQRLDETGFTGYTGGAEGFGFSEVSWKSIEHNIDVYAAFSKMDSITGVEPWLERAQHAREFIEAMFDPDGPFFRIGTTDFGDINYDGPLVEDAQSWAMLVLEAQQYKPVIEWAKENFLVTHDGFTGFDFDTDQDGVWFEGTAHMAMACYMISDFEGYDYYIDQLRQAQASASNTDGMGIVAACHEGVTTGLTWEYFDRLHVGATAWYILAEKRWNPYWNRPLIVDTEEPVPKDAASASLRLYPSYPNPCAPGQTVRIGFRLPGSGVVSIRLLGPYGQLIANLSEGYLPAGLHEVEWKAEREAPGGIYLVQLQTHGATVMDRVVVIR
ncbi:MAG: hypothetical protein J5I94_05045 [Phaeodactylibacter sp.]|nr:hypothetical protein [Phaeodactylibacter sp.]